MAVAAAAEVGYKMQLRGNRDPSKVVGGLHYKIYLLTHSFQSGIKLPSSLAARQSGRQEQPVEAEREEKGNKFGSK
jgi:hypothetical protein